MNGNTRSESVEMYLKSLAELGGEHGPVPIGQVANRMGVSPVSANEMMKRLVEDKFVEHQPYKGVTLTGSGRRLANNVIRRQRLWECFLVDHLELDWAKAHDLACDLEHATAPEVVDALASYLGNPTQCPHGNPIPDPEGEMDTSPAVPLSNLAVADRGRIAAIVPQSSEVLAYLEARGVRPGQHVIVMEAAPLQGPLTVRIGGSSPGTGSEVVLGLKLAELVLIEEIIEE